MMFKSFPTVTATVIVLFSSSLRAATLDWTGNGLTSATSDRLNWNPQVAPGFRDTLRFGIGGTYTVSAVASYECAYVVTAGNPEFEFIDDQSRVDTLDVNGGTARFRSDSSFVNCRVTQIYNGGTLRNDLGMPNDNGSFPQAGQAALDQIIVHSGGTLINNGRIFSLGAFPLGPPAPSVFSVDLGGTVRGSGIFVGRRLTNAGTVSPGEGDDDVSRLAFPGGYTQTSTGTLDLEVRTVLAYDYIQSTSSILGGTLKVSLANINAVGPSNEFLVVRGNYSGQFDTLNLPDGWGIRYDPNAIYVGPAVPEPSSLALIGVGVTLLLRRRAPGR